MRKFLISFLVILTVLFAGCKQNKGAKNSASSYSDENPDFTVLSFVPEDELPAAVKFPSIQIQFSKPVVALQKLGEPSDKSDIVTIEPALKGVFRWYGTSLLSFESSEAVIPQTVYTVKINSKASALDGTKYSGQTEYQFHTEELKMTSIVPGYGEVKEGRYVDSNDLEPTLARDVAIFFNAPVNADFVAKELKVFNDSDANKTQFTFTAVQESQNGIRLTINETLPENSKIVVSLPEGSSSDKGCYPTSKSQERSYKTLSPFRMTNFLNDGMYTDKVVANPVTFVMSHQITAGSEAEVATWFSTTPSMKISAENITLLGSNIMVHDLPVTFGSEYKIKISGEAHDVYGRKLGSPAEMAVKVPQARSYAAYKDYGFKMLESEFAPKLVFEHQNIKDGSYYTLTPVANATGGLADKGDITVNLNPQQIPQNQRIIEAVDLIPALQETSTGYHGTVAFNAKINYEYRYTPWNSDETQIRSATSTNTQYVQVTDLGLSVRYGYNKIVALVTSLSTGKPVANATVNAYMVPRVSATNEKVFSYVRGTQPDCYGTTDANGFVTLKVPAKMFAQSGSLYVEAKTKEDRAIFQPNIYNMWATSVYNTGYPNEALEEKQVTFMFTDRGLYKPGETVTFRTIDRTLTQGEYSAYAKKPCLVQFTDGSWRHSVYDETSGNTSENGTFWGTFKIPEDIEPGIYALEYLRGSSSSSYNRKVCYIQIQYFERLRFEASASIPDITYYSGDKLNAEISAQYLGGGSMGGASYSSSWTREPVGFGAKGSAYDGYTFGPRQGYDGRTWIGDNYGVLNGEGKATESIETGGEKLKGMAYSYRLETEVVDAGNQAISASTRTVVHPSKFYVGLSAPKNVNGFAKKGDTVTFDYVCLTPDETAPLAKDLPSDKTLKVELLRYDWKQVQQISWNGQINTRYEREMVTEEEKTVPLSGSALANSFTVVPPKGGSYLLRVYTTDSRENEIITERSFYVTSSDWYWFNRDNSEEISMTPDKELYSVGDTAHILMQSPLEKGTYIMTVEREGIVSEKLLTLDVPTTVIDVPIQESFVPVMYVTLSSYSVRSEKPQNDYDTPDVAKPKGYFGLATLCVDPAYKSFDIDITTDKPSYRPGQKATVTLHASKDGRPVSNAEITLMAVDRGVIDLIDYHVPDPVEYFYARYLFPDCVKGGDSRSLLIDPVTYEIKNLIGGDADDGDLKLNERKNFDPTAVFVPSIITDSNGNATYTFTLPDTLTAYRVTAVGVNKNSFALTESQIDVAEPISVRQVLPRKLRLNDKGEVGVTISNLEAGAHSVTVTANVYDGIEKTGVAQDEGDVAKLPGHAKINGSLTQTLSVAGSTTQSMMFAIDALEPGWITVEFVVTSDLVNERILVPLEIEKPYIYETVTTVGEVAADKAGASATEMLIIPGGAEDGMGSIYIQLDPTRLGTLSEAVRYVFHYPYGCMEQRSAAVLPLVAFGDYIDVFDLASEVKNPKKVASKEIASWKNVQRSDGGFPYWPSGTQSSLEVSLRIGEIAYLAESNGVSMRGGIDVTALHNYIKSLVKFSKNNSSYSNYINAYAVYVAECLSDGKDDFDSALNALVSSAKSDLNTLALCGLSYLKCGKPDKANDVAKKIRNYTKYSTRGIDLTSTQNEPLYWSYLNGKTEDYALLLQFFSTLNPDDDINQHLVYELLEMQKASRGYWVSTAQTTRALIALDTYIKQEHLEDTDFSAEALLNKKSFVQGSFKGVGAKPVEKTADFSEDPVSSQKRDKEIPVEFDAKGSGKLFYTLSMKYAIPVNEQTARDEGICIFTVITDVKTGEVVTGDKLVAGNIYRETVYVTSTRMREHVAVRAPIPAGCEVLNAAFVTTGTVPPAETEEDEDGYYRQYNWGLSHQAIYDSEVQYFWDYFAAGNQKVEFLFRATRKGTYNTPSSTAECMYQEEIFGRSNGKVWTIE